MNEKQTSFADSMLSWHAQYGRKHLPWQGKNPYHVWISEIMLQQTQVNKVIIYFENFMRKFPTLVDLAEADVADVLASWSGLGYYNRAKNLHKTAKICTLQHDGTLPKSLTSLMDLPGIGKTTAGAILSLASNKPYAILDGNVKRVLSRVYAISSEKVSRLEKKLWALSESLVPQNNPKDYNQSLMDLGSMICKRATPLCDQCPVNNSCLAQQRNEIRLYPQPKKKTAKKHKLIHALMIMDEYRVFLQKRSNKGIWPQLWFFPTFDDEQDLMAMFQQLSLKPIAQFTVEHILTHRIFEIKISYAQGSLVEGLAGQWHDASNLGSVPHPSALVKILNHLKTKNIDVIR